MANTKQQLNDITSKEFLDKALKNAIRWCKGNLPTNLKGFGNGMDYSIFYYTVDNELLGPDMTFDDSGQIRVSTEKLKWYREREQYLRKDKLYRRIEEPAEVDPESMFVHEITEFVLFHRPNLFDFETFCLEYLFLFHETAWKVENINRKERSLNPWPKY